MGNITTEQKLKLTQMIRAESQDNRLRMRSRERLLYGGNSKTTLDNPPIYCKDSLEYVNRNEKELYALEEVQHVTQMSSYSSFKLRLILSVFLFAAFLIMDAGGATIGGITTKLLQDEINKDLDIGISSINFDFTSNFPYTLFENK